MEINAGQLLDGIESGTKRTERRFRSRRRHDEEKLVRMVGEGAIDEDQNLWKDMRENTSTSIYKTQQMKNKKR
jgi:hypothetical protein